MKNSFYFDHDYNARNDQKVLIIRAKFGSKGYGVFWMLVEMMAEATMPHLNLNHIPAIAVAINEDPKWLEEFVAYCINDAHIFVCDGIAFANHRVIRHKNFRESFVTYGERGAKKRWNNPPNSPPNNSPKKNSPPNNPPNAKEIKERRVNISDGDFLTSLKNNIAFKHINIEAELGKMDAYCLAHHRQKTRKFIVGWLNRIDKPLEIKQEPRRIL